MNKKLERSVLMYLSNDVNVIIRSNYVGFIVNSDFILLLLFIKDFQ